MTLETDSPSWWRDCHAVMYTVDVIGSEWSRASLQYLLNNVQLRNCSAHDVVLTTPAPEVPAKQTGPATWYAIAYQGANPMYWWNATLSQTLPGHDCPGGTSFCANPRQSHSWPYDLLMDFIACIAATVPVRKSNDGVPVAQQLRSSAHLLCPSRTYIASLRSTPPDPHVKS